MPCCEIRDYEQRIPTNSRIVKRALRAIQSPAYEKARKKNPALPEVNARAALENAFKLLPLSMLALRVTKIDPHEGHDHAPVKKGKRTKGLWDVRIVPQQDAEDDMCRCSSCHILGSSGGASTTVQEPC